MKLTLSKIALIACVATSAFAATSANAAPHRTDGCQFAFFEGCGIVFEQPNPGRSRSSVIPVRDTSPTYMKQTDPRYSSSMRDAGGGGGGGGGGR
ncbi:hypothetical protein ABIA00_001711 [Bradyrhizobium ottawaense]|uniref:hypothetical protein n=1 Tax=Bradyrhizobium ottawaense TaxID=931866 RepID=UPI0038346490